MNVLVTGGAGFIGSHLVDAYLAQGHDVAVIDNLSSGRRENVNPAARFYQVDIGDPAVDEILGRERPELVNHHAAQIEVRTSIAEPEKDIQHNIVGLVRLVTACIEHKTRMFVFASTGGAIYGEPDRSPVPESAPVRPLSPYGVDKVAGELYLKYYEATHGLQVRILRYANVYGPRQNAKAEAGVIAIFLKAMLSGQRPRIFGDGTQQRDFVYVGDVVRAGLAAPNAPNSDPINIGTGEMTSVNALYQALCEATGFDQPPLYESARAGDVHSISLDPTLAGKRLGWKPETDLCVGVRQTAEYFKSEL
jgi:UDP-glucose 4-epimerase